MGEMNNLPDTLSVAHNQILKLSRRLTWVSELRDKLSPEKQAMVDSKISKLESELRQAKASYSDEIIRRRVSGIMAPGHRETFAVAGTVPTARFSPVESVETLNPEDLADLESLGDFSVGSEIEI